MRFERLPLLLGKARLFLLDARDGLLLRALVALALLAMLGEQRLALLREALFHLAFSLLPRINVRFARHGTFSSSLDVFSGDFARLIAPLILR